MSPGWPRLIVLQPAAASGNCKWHRAADHFHRQRQQTSRDSLAAKSDSVYDWALIGSSSSHYSPSFTTTSSPIFSSISSSISNSSSNSYSDFDFQFGDTNRSPNASHRQLTQISLSRPILGGNQNCTPSQAEFQLGAYSRLAFYLCAGFSNCCSVAFSVVANSDSDLHSSLAVVALICFCCLRLLHELKVPLYTLSESESCVFPKLKSHRELVMSCLTQTKHQISFSTTTFSQ